MVHIIRKIRTAIMIGIMVAGMCVVLSVSFSFVRRSTGHTNAVYEFLTQNVNVELSWTQNLPGREPEFAVPISIKERFYNIVIGVEQTIEDLATASWPGIESVKSIANLYKEELLCLRINQSVDGQTIDQKAYDAVESVESFASYCEDLDIEFLYVNLPGFERIGGEEETPGILALSDEFASALENDGVSILNVTEDTSHEYSLEETHHWMPADALYVTGLLSDRLNEEFGLDFDHDIFQVENYYDYFNLKNKDLAELVQVNHGYDFDLLVPVDSPEYVLIEDNLNAEKIGALGDFAFTYLKEPDAWCDGGPYFETSRVCNGGYFRIKNISGTNNDGKRILFLGDSYTWFMMDYLSQDVEEISYLNPGLFMGGNVGVYIEDYEPDIIVWAYQEGQLSGDLFEWVEEDLSELTAGDKDR